MKEQVLSSLQVKCWFVLGGSSALYHHKLTPKIPGDLDILVSPSQFVKACVALEELGFTTYLDNPSSKGFDLRRQYKKGSEKVDLFIIGENFGAFTGSKDGNLYADPSIVWAARGYYAAKGATKYQDQLIEAGYWDESRRPNFKLVSHINKVKWFLRRFLNW